MKAETLTRKARAIASRTGIMPGPNSPLLEVSGRVCRNEDAEAEQCDDYIARIAGAAGVVRFSQPRETMQTVGISDRRYRVHGFAFFFELKAADGQLTAKQHAFLLDELQHGALAGVGTLDDLVVLTELLRRARLIKGESAPTALLMPSIIDACSLLIETWADRGFRPEPPPRKARRRR